MKRNEVLQRLGFSVPEGKTKRVIVHTDAKNEADDDFAIIQHLLTPSEDVRGIIGAHFEFFPRVAEKRVKAENGDSSLISGSAYHFASLRGKTAEMSYEECKKVLSLAEIDDVPLFLGSRFELTDKDNLPESEGADFIIKEAMSNDSRPLYIVFLGSVTDMAIAYLKEPKIADRLTVVMIAGGAYPNGCNEFNLSQDVPAVRIVFESPLKVWQVPSNAYSKITLSLAELMDHVYPCGKIGKYLCEQMLEFNDKCGNNGHEFPHGESWSIGDNPTVSVLLSNANLWHIEKAPLINDDFSYTANALGKEIRVYDEIDHRLTISDMFSKIKLCYGKTL